MSSARPILPEVSLMLTRRVAGRQFLLLPSRRVNHIVGYVVAVMQAKWSIALHAIDVLSNHHHLVCTDADGNIARFQQDCHSFITRALNAHRGDFESMWSNEQGSRVECEEPADIIEKIAYTMANPVEAGLVRHGHSWPGLRRAWPSKPMVFKKPKKFFRGEEDGGVWPEEAVLELSRPPGYDHLTDEELAALIEGAIDEREERFRAKRDADGRSFLGRRAVLRQSRLDRPRTREPRFGISPKVACRNKWRRIERLRANQHWSAAYRRAMASWRAGDRGAIFPLGTYKMRLLHGVTCDQAPD